MVAVAVAVEVINMRDLERFDNLCLLACLSVDLCEAQMSIVILEVFFSHFETRTNKM